MWRLICLTVLSSVSAIPAAAENRDFDFRLGFNHRDVWNCDAGSFQSFPGEFYQDRLSSFDSASCNKMAYKVFGGIDYNRDLLMVGGEFGYWDYHGIMDTGRYRGKDAALSSDPIANGGRDEFDGFYYGLRLGLNFWEKRLTPYITGGFHAHEFNALWDTALSEHSAYEDAGVDPYYGLGVEYDFWRLRGQRAFSLRGEWERFDFGDMGGVDFYGISVLYEFDL